MSSHYYNNNDYEKMINDKVFQYFYQKMFDNSKDYNSFKFLSNEKQISFLIKLFLFISTSSTPISFNPSHNVSFDNKENIPQMQSSTLGEIIKSKLDYILSKHKLPSLDSYYKLNSGVIKEGEEDNNCISEENNPEIKEENNQHLTNVSEIHENSQNTKDASLLQFNNTHYRTLYAKIRYDPNIALQNKETLNIERNNFELFKEVTIDYNIQNLISVKNDIIESESHKDVNNLTRTINHPQFDKFYIQNYKNLTDPSKKCYITKSINQLLFHKIKSKNYSVDYFSPVNTYKTEQNSFFSVSKKNIFIGQNEQIMQKTNPKTKGKNKTMVLNDVVLINQSITDESHIQLKNFNRGDLVERLFNCPANKYITLSSSEAEKVGSIIIELLRSENDLKAFIQNRNNELDKLTSLLNEQKNKTFDTEMELNLLKKEFENKKKLVDKYIQNINEKIENTKDIFDEKTNINENNTNIEINDKIHQEILKEINNNLLLLQG